MSESPHVTRSVLLSMVFGLCSLPMILFGGYFFVCWLRIHMSNVYYVDYSYAAAALKWTGVGLFSLLVTLYGAWRRSFYGLLFLVPLFLGFGTMVTIPDGRPQIFGSMIADTNYLSDVNSFLRVWYEEHQRFPSNESEFREAMAKGPAAWQYRGPPAPKSRYKQHGNPLPYELIVVTNAAGPRVTDVSQRPGVIYYSVSGDLQEFWVTMTGLPSDVAPAATIKRVADRPEMEYWIVHAAGHDYQVKKQ